ncbi:MAG: NUDIX hydrolase, partial [Patescibacteria group bacterium]
PAGMREENEDPLETAKRELREEAGVIAKKWTALGSFYMECSSTNKESFAFLAEDLELGEGNPDDDEEIESRWLPLEEALKKVASGEIKDGLTCLGLLRAQSILRV